MTAWSSSALCGKIRSSAEYCEWRRVIAPTQSRSDVSAGTIPRAGLIAGCPGIRAAVEENAIVDVYASVVGRLDIVAREVIPYGTKRCVAIDPQPVFERQL